VSAGAQPPNSAPERRTVFRLRRGYRTVVAVAHLVALGLAPLAARAGVVGVAVWALALTASLVHAGGRLPSRIELGPDDVVVSSWSRRLRTIPYAELTAVQTWDAARQRAVWRTARGDLRTTTQFERWDELLAEVGLRARRAGGR
jgi:hypothetical protein